MTVVTKQKEALAHALRLRFGISPQEPTEQQLDRITIDISRIAHPTHRDWHDAVYRHCPTAGTYKYASVDNSDLNELLAQASEGAKAQGKRG